VNRHGGGQVERDRIAAEVERTEAPRQDADRCRAARDEDGGDDGLVREGLSVVGVTRGTHRVSRVVVCLLDVSTGDVQHESIPPAR